MLGKVCSVGKTCGNLWAGSRARATEKLLVNRVVLSRIAAEDDLPQLTLREVKALHRGQGNGRGEFERKSKCACADRRKGN